MKIIYTILILTFVTVHTFAQKLPDVQSSNLAAPSTVKIDGKATEWNDVYAAENKRTDLSYSIANDDKNLYFILKSTSSAKIFAGGITVTVNTQGKKREKDGFSITYPLVPRTSNRAQGGGGNGGQGRQGFGGAQGGGANQNRTPQQRDSIQLIQRKADLAKVKEIKVSGFKIITDSLISIYNEYGIKAVGSFDAKGAYIYEMAIPLSLLELVPTDSKEFVYQIKVNGRPENPGNGANAGNGNGAGNFSGSAGGAGGRGNGGGNPGGGNLGGNNNRTGSAGNANQDLNSPTDFWGKYTLVKK